MSTRLVESAVLTALHIRLRPRLPCLPSRAPGHGYRSRAADRRGATGFPAEGRPVRPFSRRPARHAVPRARRHAVVADAQPHVRGGGALPRGPSRARLQHAARLGARRLRPRRQGDVPARPLRQASRSRAATGRGRSRRTGRTSTACFAKTAELGLPRSSSPRPTSAAATTATSRRCARTAPRSCGPTAAGSAARYGSLSNVVWVHGGDRSPYDVRDEVRAVARGIRESGPRQLHIGALGVERVRPRPLRRGGLARLQRLLHLRSGRVARALRPRAAPRGAHVADRDPLRRRLRQEDRRGRAGLPVPRRALGRPWATCSATSRSGTAAAAGRRRSTAARLALHGATPARSSSRARGGSSSRTSRTASSSKGTATPARDDGVQAAVTAARDTLIAYLPARRALRVDSPVLCAARALRGFWFDPRTGDATRDSAVPARGRRAASSRPPTATGCSCSTTHRRRGAGRRDRRRRPLCNDETLNTGDGRHGAARPRPCSRSGRRRRTSGCPTSTAAPSSCPTSPSRPALLVMFICNHCPFVKHVRPELARLGREYDGARRRDRRDQQQRRRGSTPKTGPPAMKAEKAAAGYTFPYLLRRDAGGREGVPRRVHARPLPLRRAAAARLPRAARRQPPRQRRAGHRPATCARRSTRCCAGRPVDERAAPERRLQHQVEAGQRARLLQRLTRAAPGERRCRGTRSGGSWRGRRASSRPRTSTGSRRTRPPLADGEVLVRDSPTSRSTRRTAAGPRATRTCRRSPLGGVMRGFGVGRVVESRAPAASRPATRSRACSAGSVTRSSTARPLAKLPDVGLPLEAHLGLLGHIGLTAWVGLLEIGRPKAGETLVVSAAAGAVGLARRPDREDPGPARRRHRRHATRSAAG